MVLNCIQVEFICQYYIDKKKYIWYYYAALVELVCPTQGETLFAEHLRQRGESIHHVAFSVDDLRAERARLTAMGICELMRFIRADGTGASFFDLRNNGSFIVELVQAQPPK